MSSRLPALALLCAVLVQPVIARPTARYVFDRSGTQNDLGTPPAANATLAGDAAPVYVSPNGYSCGSLDLTPNGANHNYATTGVDVNKLDALASMTVTLWVNLRGTPAADDCLVSDVASFNAPADQGGWQLRIVAHEGVAPTASNFRIAYEVVWTHGGWANLQAQTSEPINADDRWVFLAVTYDDEPSTNFYRQRYYVGQENVPIAQLGEFDSLYSLRLLDNTTPLRIGSNSGEPDTDRTPPAWIDDVRVYDRALTQAELEQVRQENLMNLQLNATPAFFGLGGLSGGPCVTWAAAISADGSTVVGQALSAPLVRPFRWKDGVMDAAVNQPPAWIRGSATDVSADGSVVVGYGSSSPSISDWRSFRWEGDNVLVLDSLPGGDDSGFANGVSADGSVIVGSASGPTGPNEAYRWEAGVTAPVPMPAVSQSLPTDVSADGRIIVGYYSLGISDVRAFRYENGLFEDLGQIPSALDLGSRLRISTNNQAIAGWGQPNGLREAVLWRGGQVFGLGDLPGGAFESEATAVSANGSYIVGVSRVGTTELAAFIWDRFHGMRNLRDVLISEYGLDLEGWKLNWATGISDDGSAITGYGPNPAGIPEEAWLARLPIPPAATDLDADGDVDADDVDLFVSCVTGPDMPYAGGGVPPGCSPGLDVLGMLPADLDWDGDVDQEDFGMLQLCISGANVPPPAECAG